MLQYAGKRILFLIPTLYLVVTVVFLLVHLIPGDPVDFILGENAMSSDRNRLVRQLKLDQPLWLQHSYFISGLVKGDLGRSLYDQEPVWKKIRRRFIPTFKLAMAAMAVGRTGFATFRCWQSISVCCCRICRGMAIPRCRRNRFPGMGSAQSSRRGWICCCLRVRLATLPASRSEVSFRAVSPSRWATGSTTS